MGSRFCIPCYFARKKEKQAARKEKRKRVDPYPKLGKEWADKRAARGIICQKCGCLKTAKVRLILDHIVPARIASQRGDPNDDINLQDLCDSCHGEKTSGCEPYLFRNDLLGFLTAMNRFGFSIKRTKDALTHYQFYVGNLTFGNE
jgi:HNH endonuclease